MSIPSIATQRPLQGCKCSAYLDWLQMLSGVGLVAFMCMHLVFVSSVIVGPGVMNGLSHFFEASGMAQIGGPAIFALLLLHFALAARKIPFATKQQSVMLANARRMQHTDTWLWVVQAVSGMIILIMGSIHLWTVLTDLPITAEKNAMRLQESGAWVAFYLVFIPMVWAHTGVGVYRVLVKWGFISNESRPGLKKKDAIVTAAVIGIGLITMVRLLFLSIK